MWISELNDDKPDPPDPPEASTQSARETASVSADDVLDDYERPSEAQDDAVESEPGTPSVSQAEVTSDPDSHDHDTTNSEHHVDASGAPDQPEIPNKAQETLDHIDRTGEHPPGYVGGADFDNDGRGGGEVLPRFDADGEAITYREWDVDPYQDGVNRTSDRVVTGSDDSAYYTSDHYETFTRMR